MLLLPAPSYLFLMPAAIPSPIAWTSDCAIRLLDQTLLPEKEHYVELRSTQELAEAIRTLRVRGAPLIGIAAAMGVAMERNSAKKLGSIEARDGLSSVREVCRILGATRPTAVNLHWALDRMLRRAETAVENGEDLGPVLLAEANAIWEEDRVMCRQIGEAGARLIPEGGTVATICNAGALATGGIGTALAPLYLLHEHQVPLRVLVPETRPLLQGSRLTAWELNRAGIPVTVMTDSMMATRLRRRDVRAVFVGADRIAANGDVANKVGTYSLALAARAQGIPFYVAAPSSTIDPATPDGSAIPIEQRPSGELTQWHGHSSTPAGVDVWNPAFDVTPAELVTAIVSDRGVLEPSQVLRSLEGDYQPAGLGPLTSKSVP
jgi:methylthioribose-1-phosphate isomerase